MLIDDLGLILEWGGSKTSLGDGFEPSEHTYETSGSIVAFGDDDIRQVIGRFRTFYVDADAANKDGLSTFDTFDAHMSTVDYYEAIFKAGTGFAREDLEKLIRDDIFNRNV